MPPTELDQIESIASGQITMQPISRNLGDLSMELFGAGMELFLVSDPHRIATTYVAADQTPAIDLIRAIERMTGLKWWEVELSQWELAPDRRQALSQYGSPLPPARLGYEYEFGRAHRRISAEFIRSLTPEQWNRMAGGVVLQFSELSARQQSLLLGKLHARTFAGPGSSGPTREARLGKVAIYIDEAPDPNGSPGLAYAYPSRGQPGYEPLNKTRDQLDYANYDYITRQADGAYVPSNPRRRLYPPGRAPRRPADPTPEEDRKDPRLQRTLDLGSEPPSWEKLVAEMQKATGLAVFLAGDYLKKPAPFAVDRMRVIEVMDRLAKETGRRWERIGELRLLAPLPKEEEQPGQGDQFGYCLPLMRGPNAKQRPVTPAVAIRGVHLFSN